ncbi:unnamed protein product, partial [marine sediment metagenome]
RECYTQSVLICDFNEGLDNEYDSHGIEDIS